MVKINDTIVNLSVEDIHVYEGSHHNESVVALLEQSIKTDGITQPISVDSNHVIVTGNAVYKAAVRLGYKEIPCIVLDYLSEEQIAQYRIADNKTGQFAKWNEEKLKKELSYMERPEELQFAFDENIMNMLGQSPVVPSKPTPQAPAPVASKGAQPVPPILTPEYNAAKAEQDRQAVENFKSQLKAAEEGMKPQPMQYIEHVCTKCGKVIRIRK